MAITILPKQGSFAEDLSTGIGGALQQLAMNKIQQVQQQKQAQGLQALLGLSPEKAYQASYAPESVLKEFTKQQLAAPQQAAYLEALQSILGNQTQNEPKLGQQLEAEQTPELLKSSSNGFNLPQKGITSGQATQLAKFGLEKNKQVKEEAYREKKLEFEKAKQSNQEKIEAFKQTQKLREGLHKESKAAKTALQDLNRMQELEKEGKLDTPGYAEFLKRSGFDIPALMNPGSEEFNKIVGNFQRGAKDIYGARITNFELESFLKILPSLSQSPEGRKRVISNLKKLYQGNLAYKKAADKIIKDNKGVPPLDLMEKIDEEVDPMLNKIAEQFKKDLSKPVPAGQNRFITGLQSAAGSAVGTVGKPLAGAAVGGLIGGPLGAGLGALGGLGWNIINKFSGE